MIRCLTRDLQFQVIKDSRSTMHFFSAFFLFFLGPRETLSKSGSFLSRHLTTAPGDENSEENIDDALLSEKLLEIDLHSIKNDAQMDMNIR